MKITIIRHAEPDYLNNTLTEKGFREAEYLGEYFRDEKIDYLYVSPLNRAKFTAEAILKYNTQKNYKILDFLHEFVPVIWDNEPLFLNENPNVYDKDKWMQVPPFNNENIISRYNFIKEEFEKLLKSHGYEKNGVLYDVQKPNHDHIVLVCHFGLESFLLSQLFNVSPIALLNHTCARPSAITTVVTEERIKGKALFRMYAYGELYHLHKKGENPSFMARFDEVFGDGNGIFKK